MKTATGYRVAIGVVLAAGMLLAGTAGAQPVYWLGKTSTDWADAANWTNRSDDTVVAPGPGTNVVIDLIDIPTFQPLLNLSSGSVTIASLVVSGGTSSVTLTFTNGNVDTTYLNVTGDVTIGTNGTLTHAAETDSAAPWDENQRLRLDVGGNLTMAPGGQINVDAKGYSGGKGPGVGAKARVGGGHGGESGFDAGQSGLPPYGGDTYGSITNPVNSGSGGNSGSTRAGGVVVLRVTGAITNNGLITANGAFNGGGGAGAGGSINVTAGSITGATGRVSAGGGLVQFSNNPGGGGGGRVALVVTNSGATIPAAILANITVVGGTINGASSSQNGAAGTIYLRTASQSYGDLIVDNTNLTTRARYTVMQTATDQFHSITLTNQGVFAVGTNAALLLDGCTLHTGGSTANRLIIKDNGQLSWTGTWTNTGKISQQGLGAYSLPGSLVVASNAVLTHEAGTNNWLKLDLGNNDLAVDTGGAINAQGSGFPVSGGRSGGRHGGEGGWGNDVTPGTPNTPTYGSITNPITHGESSARSAGGGVVVIQGSGTVSVNVGGQINAAGITAGPGGGGAGGSANIHVGQLLGAGGITVDGGAGGATEDGGGGGGGRIAVVLSGAPAPVSFSMSANGGGSPGLPSHGSGGAGTIYLRGTDSPGGKGLLRISNNQTAAASVTTLLSPQVTDALVGDVQLLGTTKFAIASNATLTVYGSWSNAVGATAISGGTVDLAGSAAATVWGDNNWSNLIINTAGKVVSFEAGKTQTVSGIPAFSNVTLQSTAAAQWMLTKGAPGGTQSVGVVTVSYSDASGGATFEAAIDSSDLGNNDNWKFLKPGGTVFQMR